MVSFVGSRWQQRCRVWSRRPWRSRLRFSALLTLCLTFVIACTGSPTADSNPSTDAGAEATGNRISMGTTLTARTLDPADAYEIFPGILLHNLGDQLYAYEPGTTDLIPQLATEMPTVSDDGLT